MRPITFENLRRLVGGGKKKKDKESSFKRSDSFKRISIRKSYLDRGKKKQQEQRHLHKLEAATQTVDEEIAVIESSVEDPQPVVRLAKVDSSVQVEINKDIAGVTKLKKSTREVSSTRENREGPGQSVIAYGQWLKGIRKDDMGVTHHSTGAKGAERTVIYVPASDEIKPAPPVIRQLSSSPVIRKKAVKSSPTLQRKESNDSAVEMFPWGDSVDVKKSPLIRRRHHRAFSPAPLMPDSGTEELCSLSISLGRIWMDAPQAMAPRSLEMPRTSTAAVGAHNSLDSALKDLRDDPIVINRLQKRPGPPVGRTLSSTSNTTASTGLFSSKDSGFSFSISIPKLSDESIVSRGFFRKKRPKPKLSVSRDGYFKRTSGAALIVDSKRSSIKRRSSRNGSMKKTKSGSLRKKSSSKNNHHNTAKNEMYQVVVSRPPRCLKSLKLDPMIFVPPEKRKTTSVKRKQSFKVAIREIRHFNVSTETCGLDSDEGLYESLPGDLEDFSEDEHPLLTVPVPTRISSLADKCNLPMSTTVTTASSSSRGGVHCGRFSPSDYDNDNELSSSTSQGRPYVPPGRSPVPKRRQVRRRKSSLVHKKSITYNVKPTIIRAPSTLKKPKKNDCRKIDAGEAR